MKKKLKVGRDFPLDANVVEAQVKVSESKVRSLVAAAIVGLCALFVLGAAVLGLLDHTFDELQNVWIVSGPLVGAVAAYYFGGKNGNGREPSG